MMEVQTIYIYSFLPVLAASFILFYYLIKSWKNYPSHFGRSSIHSDEIDNFYLIYNCPLLVEGKQVNSQNSFPLPNQKLRHLILKPNLFNNKDYLKNTEIQENNRNLGKPYMDQKQLLRCQPTKKIKKTRQKVKKLSDFSFCKNQLPTIFQQLEC